MQEKVSKVVASGLEAVREGACEDVCGVQQHKKKKTKKKKTTKKKKKTGRQRATEL